MHTQIIEYIRLVEPSKASIGAVSSLIANYVKDGLANPIDASIFLETLSCAAAEARSKIKDETIAEIAKHGKIAELKGVKMEIKEVGVKYDYTQCGHIQYNALKSREFLVKEEVKEFENLLKTVTKKQIFVDEESGESFEVHPPLKTSTTSAAITLPK